MGKRTRQSFGFRGNYISLHEITQPIVLELKFCQIRVCDALGLMIKDAGTHRSSKVYIQGSSSAFHPSMLLAEI